MIAKHTAPSWTRWLFFVLVAGGLLAYPWALGIVYTNIFIYFAIFAVFAASLNMLVS